VVPPIQKHGGRPALEDEAFRLKPGELSGIVNIGENWLILRCIGRTVPKVQPDDFEKVRAELQKDIHEKKLRMAMSERFEQVRQASQIDNYLAGTTQLGSQAASARSAQAVQQRLPFAVQK
jgi:parvulin-like peptidyl-prolyl isomerase